MTWRYRGFNLKRLTFSIVAMLGIAGLNLSWIIASAAGNAAFSLTSSSNSYPINTTFTVSIYENSGAVEVNGVDTILAYDSAKLEFVSVATTGSPFEFCLDASGSGGRVTISCLDLEDTSITNNQLIGTVTFKTLVGSGTTAVNFQSDSIIASKGENSTNVWNQNTNGKTFSLTTPTSSPQQSSSNNSATSSSGASSSTSLPDSGYSSTSVAAQQTNPATPVQATEDKPLFSGENPLIGFLVAIKVVDDKNKTIEGATVTLGDKTTTSDTTGIASFLGISAGKHSVTVKDKEGKVLTTSTIEVTKEGLPTDVQELIVKLQSKTQDEGLSYVIVVPTTLLLLLLLAFGISPAGQQYLKRLNMMPKRHALQSIPAPVPPSSSRGVNEMLGHIHVDLPWPSEIIKPTKPPKH